MKKQRKRDILKSMKPFKRTLFMTILLTYLVILAGAIVRGTGSGLGCPDWPRCFGQWVPPTDITELPDDYKTKFQIAGKVIADFDPFKTWTEYLNRLVGAVLGFFILVLFLRSFRIHEEKNISWYCGGLLILVMAQGGLGALVVSTHLKPIMITLHMLLAMLLLFGLLYLKKYCDDLEDTGVVIESDPKMRGWSNLLLGMVFFQVLLGTQVRQLVDHLMRDTMKATPETVIDQLGILFYLHRSFSILVLGLFVFLLIKFHREHYNRKAFFLTFSAFLCALVNVVSGVALNYFSFPAEAQPPHLFFAIICVSLLYSLRLHLKGTLIN